MAHLEGLSREDQQALEEGLRTFNAGDFYAAHDHFEALWGEAVWKGFVQAAVALHHYAVRNMPGVRGLPESASRILDTYRPAYQGLDIERFATEFRTFFEAVDRGEEPDVTNAPKIHLVADHGPRDRPKRDDVDRH